MGETNNLVENFKVEKVIFNCREFNELENGLIKVLDENIRTMKVNKTRGIIIYKLGNHDVIGFYLCERVIAREIEFLWYNK